MRIQAAEGEAGLVIRVGCSVCGARGPKSMFWSSRMESGDTLCTFCWGWAWHLGLNANTHRWGVGTLTRDRIAQVLANS